jgi:hypothetical protein
VMVFEKSGTGGSDAGEGGLMRFSQVRQAKQYYLLYCLPLEIDTKRLRWETV